MTEEVYITRYLVQPPQIPHGRHMTSLSDSETRKHHDTRRPLSAWGSGDLPAPYAVDDIVYRVGSGSDERLRGRVDPDLPFTVVAACSIGEGDEWHFRVTQDGGKASDRLHVWYADRSDHDTDLDWMSGFQLAATQNRHSLNRRHAMLNAGWKPPVRDICPTCGHVLPETTP